MLLLARRPTEPNLSSDAKWPKMKFDFRELGSGREKVETILGEKVGQGLKKIDQKYNISFNIPSR